MAKTVIAFGSFDILHPGHIRYLTKAKSLGNRLIVIISRDESIRVLKHREPVLGQDARAVIVGSLKAVDMAVVGDRLTKPSDRYEIFRKYKPDIIVLGYDQKVDTAELKRWLSTNGIKAKVVRLRTALNEGAYKSSKLRERMRATKG